MHVVTLLHLCKLEWKLLHALLTHLGTLLLKNCVVGSEETTNILHNYGFLCVVKFIH